MGYKLEPMKRREPEGKGNMKLKIAAALCALALLPAAAQAQDNPLPQGTITFVLPFAAGGPLDSVARVLAEKLGPKISRTIVIENRGGAGGDVAAAAVVRAAPDGKTWFFTTDSALTITPHMSPKRPYDAKGLTPVAKVGEVVLLLAVNAKKVPAKTFPELVAFSKANNLSFGSAGIGSPGHMAFEYLRQVSELKGAHVPYRGAALAIQDLISGNIDGSFIVAGVLVPHVKTGVLRALAVSANRRISALPDVPTSKEAGLGDFEARFANILMAPSRVDPKIAGYMEKQVLAVAAEPDFAKKLAGLSNDAITGDGKEAGEWIAREYARWGKVIAANKPKQ